jgi:hypothetical protein
LKTNLSIKSIYEIIKIIANGIAKSAVGKTPSETPRD